MYLLISEIFTNRYLIQLIAIKREFLYCDYIYNIFCIIFKIISDQVENIDNLVKMLQFFM